MLCSLLINNDTWTGFGIGLADFFSHWNISQNQNVGYNVSLETYIFTIFPRM